MLTDFTSKISANISSLSVDTTTDTSEESDSGATETVTGDELEEDLDLVLDLSLVSLFSNTTEDSGLEDKDKDFEDTESKTDKDEAEDLTTVEGSGEAIIDAVVAKVSHLDVGGGGDHHTDVASKHGGECTNEEAESSVGEGREVVAFFPGLVDSAEEDSAEEDAEDGEV